jgi:transglutaminase-like putative cysteine protease
MIMRLLVNHITHYKYDAPVDYSLQQVRLQPKERPGQEIVKWELRVEGGKKELGFTDQHANHVDLISIDKGSDSLVIHSQGVVKMSNSSGVVGPHNGFMALWNFLRPTPLTAPGVAVDLLISELGNEFADDLSRAHLLSALITKHVPYVIGKTNSETTAEQALEISGGVCQDHAHIFIAAMRKMGFPARYVSGYLKMNDRIEQDATHAWAEAHFDNIGWVGFDVSNGYSPDNRYIRVATGCDYNDAAPVSGLRFGGTQEKLVVHLQVQQ